MGSQELPDPFVIELKGLPSGRTVVNCLLPADGKAYLKLVPRRPFEANEVAGSCDLTPNSTAEIVVDCDNNGGIALNVRDAHGKSIQHNFQHSRSGQKRQRTQDPDGEARLQSLESVIESVSDLHHQAAGLRFQLKSLLADIKARFLSSEFTLQRPESTHAGPHTGSPRGAGHGGSGRRPHTEDTHAKAVSDVKSRAGQLCDVVASISIRLTDPAGGAGAGGSSGSSGASPHGPHAAGAGAGAAGGVHYASSPSSEYSAMSYSVAKQVLDDLKQTYEEYLLQARSIDSRLRELKRQVHAAETPRIAIDALPPDVQGQIEQLSQQAKTVLGRIELEIVE